MVDYSKWQNIELSSDEDDVHPFIETSTLFRLKHEARVKKMERMKNERLAHECRKASLTQRFEEVHKTLQNQENEKQNASALQTQLQLLEAEKEELLRKENKFKTDVTWFIDTICQPGFSKTYISSSLLECTKTPEDYKTFIMRSEIYLKQFALLKTFDDTKKFLLVHQNLIQRSTLYFLVSYGIELYLKEKTDKLNIVCRQIVLLLHILELFKIYQKNSKELLISFFSCAYSAEKRFKEDFVKECEKVKSLIQKLVVSKANEIEGNDAGEDEKNQSALALNERDPVDIFNALPEDVQEAFVQQDKDVLVKALSKMPTEEAAHYMRQCIEAGLWIPEGSENISC